MSKRIFISYRRADSAGVTGRIYDYLERAFGADQVFTDIHDIPAGADFRKVLEDEINSAGIVLIIIGQQYVTRKDPNGQPRIMSHEDFVNIEASMALSMRSSKLVIPVLVNEAHMPAPEELPDNLQELPFLNAIELKNADWKTDIDKLIKTIKRRFEKAKKERIVKNAKPQAQAAPKRARQVLSSFAKVGLGFVLALFFLVAVGSSMYEEPIDPSNTSIDELVADDKYLDDHMINQETSNQQLTSYSEAGPQMSISDLVIDDWQMTSVEVDEQRYNVEEIFGFKKILLEFDGEDVYSTSFSADGNSTLESYPYTIKNNTIFSEQLNGPIRFLSDNSMQIESVVADATSETSITIYFKKMR